MKKISTLAFGAILTLWTGALAGCPTAPVADAGDGDGDGDTGDGDGDGDGDTGDGDGDGDTGDGDGDGDTGDGDGDGDTPDAGDGDGDGDTTDGGDGDGDGDTTDGGDGDGDGDVTDGGDGGDGGVTVPSEWTCDPTYYGADDGCDCGCGVDDPDCGDSYVAEDCAYNYCDIGTVLDTNSPGQCVAVMVPRCQEYCVAITESCTGDNAQFDGLYDCYDYCVYVGGWDTGTLDDTSGPTLGCRLYHAGAAASNPETHCPHAGPTGGDVCGNACDAYCDSAMQNCTDGNALFDSRTECMATCGSFPTSGNDGDATGNSLQCRTYHVGVPASYDPATHCAAAGTDGGGVCVDNPTPTCESYCADVMSTCTGDNAQYASLDA